MATRFYLRNTTTSNAPTTGKKSSANPKYTLGANNATTTEESYLMSTTIGASNATIAKNSDATTATRTQYMGRWTSEPLDAQSIASGTWTIALNLNEANTNADSFLTIAVYVADAGGSAISQTIYDSSTDLGAEWATTALGQVITFSGAAASSTFGQVLVVEVFRNTDATGQAMGTAYAQTITFNGTTAVTAGSANTASYLQTPTAVDLVFANWPAVTLNTADASAFVTSTPTLEMTGVDAQSNDIRYQVQIDTVNTFNSGSDIVIENYFPGSGLATSPHLDTVQIAQSFLGTGGALKSIEIGVTVVSGGGGSSPFWVEIYAHSGTYGGGAGVPTGSVLATSDSLSPGSSVGSLYDATFSGANQITLTSGTPYFFVIRSSGANLDYEYTYVTTNPSHPGNAATKTGAGAWTAQTYDLPFTLTVKGPTLHKISGTDAGFLNTINGGDTDPFTSGEKVSYTVQSALSDGTYYWRARGTDPSGTNNYGRFTAARTFTITTGGGGPPTVKNLGLLGVG